MFIKKYFKESEYGEKGAFRSYNRKQGRKYEQANKKEQKAFVKWAEVMFYKEGDIS